MSQSKTNKIKKANSTNDHKETEQTDTSVNTNVSLNNDNNTMITIQFSDLQKLIHNELTDALKSLNEDIASRFDDIELQMERLTNHVRNESKWLKTELLKITTTNETKAPENLQFKNEFSTINDELSVIGSSLDNLKTIPLNSQVELISDKKLCLLVLDNMLMQ